MCFVFFIWILVGFGLLLDLAGLFGIVIVGLFSDVSVCVCLLFFVFCDTIFDLGFSVIVFASLFAWLLWISCLTEFGACLKRVGLHVCFVALIVLGVFVILVDLIVVITLNCCGALCCLLVLIDCLFVVCAVLIGGGICLIIVINCVFDYLWVYVCWLWYAVSVL